MSDLLGMPYTAGKTRLRREPAQQPTQPACYSGLGRHTRQDRQVERDKESKDSQWSSYKLQEEIRIRKAKLSTGDCNPS